MATTTFSPSSSDDYHPDSRESICAGRRKQSGHRPKPEDYSGAEVRLSEIAQILALAITRLNRRRAEKAEKAAVCRDFRLDIPGDRSVHADGNFGSGE